MSPSELVANNDAVRAEERAKIVAWMRSYHQNKHAREWADAIEAHEDDDGPCVYDSNKCARCGITKLPNGRHPGRFCHC